MYYEFKLDPKSPHMGSSRATNEQGKMEDVSKHCVQRVWVLMIRVLSLEVAEDVQGVWGESEAPPMTSCRTPHLSLPLNWSGDAKTRLPSSLLQTVS